MFVRFTFRRQDERSGAAEGFFTVAYRESQRTDLEPYEREWLEELLDWFKRELKIPGALKEDRNRRAICWFKEESKPVIGKAWELATLLKERGYHLDVHRTERPGIIIHEDGHQVAAKPLRKNRRYFKRPLKEGYYDERSDR